jgi:hypothetical protein
MADDREPAFEIGGDVGRAAADKVRERVADRISRGILDEEEIARVSSLRLHTFGGDDRASEIFRRCCVTWEVDREAPITSHRPLVGPLLVAAKTLFRRALRFHTEAQLSRQRDFNWNLLLVLREILEREGRRD